MGSMSHPGSSASEPARHHSPTQELTAPDAARKAVRALAEGGVAYVVLCPGSRSAPLAYALAEAELAGRVEVLVRIDERDAGFLAVGLAAASGRPVGIVTTSGTAVGELLPAMMEANHAKMSQATPAR